MTLTTPPAPKLREYSAFSAILLSAASPSLWRDVARNWNGVGALYMLLVLVLTWIPVFTVGYVGFRKFVGEEASKYIDQLPTISITDGVVSIDAPEPYVIVDPDTGDVLAIIDTTGETTLAPGETGILLTESELIIRETPTKTQSHDLSQVPSFTLDQQKANRWLNVFARWGPPLLGAVLLIVSFVWRLILMLMFGLIGMAFASGFNANLSYPALMRLSAIAMTPAILLSTILELASIHIGCMGIFISLAIILTVLALAIRANGEETRPGGFPIMTTMPPPPAR